RETLTASSSSRPGTIHDRRHEYERGSYTLDGEGRRHPRVVMQQRHVGTYAFARRKRVHAVEQEWRERAAANAALVSLCQSGVNCGVILLDWQLVGGGNRIRDEHAGAQAEEEMASHGRREV